ncbi:hypothetical protein EXW59_03045 (plasmid) [Bacillus mycoides]|nr:hypothetical protein EXW59_03045 [Bacillus mycoides]
MPSSDLNHFTFNNMYWTSIQIQFYHISRKMKANSLIYLMVLSITSLYLLNSLFFISPFICERKSPLAYI